MSVAFVTSYQAKFTSSGTCTVAHDGATEEGSVDYDSEAKCVRHQGALDRRVLWLATFSHPHFPQPLCLSDPSTHQPTSMIGSTPVSPPHATTTPHRPCSGIKSCSSARGGACATTATAPATVSLGTGAAAAPTPCRCMSERHSLGQQTHLSGRCPNAENTRSLSRRERNERARARGLERYSLNHFSQLTLNCSSGCGACGAGRGGGGGDAAAAPSHRVVVAHRRTPQRTASGDNVLAASAVSIPNDQGGGGPASARRGWAGERDPAQQLSTPTRRPQKRELSNSCSGSPLKRCKETNAALSPAFRRWSRP